MQDKELYNYISSFIVLGENNERFIKSLSKEYGWSTSFSKKVYQEYLKFMYLSAISKTSLSPSLQIDKVWKFHLGYSDSYWHKLCEIIIKKPIHRGFSSSVNKGIEKDFFIDVHLKYYEEFNQKPPKLIWGVPHNKYINNLMNNSIFLFSRRYCIFFTSIVEGELIYYFFL